MIFVSGYSTWHLGQRSLPLSLSVGGCCCSGGAVGGGCCEGAGGGGCCCEGAGGVGGGPAAGRSFLILKRERRILL